MRTYCMRSACRGHAEALVSLNVAESTFTVRDLAEVDGPGRVVLCEMHLDRLRAPVGWTLHDERTGGDLVAFPGTGGAAAGSNVADLIEAPTPRAVDAALHPLAKARRERDPEVEPVPEPVPARAELGVDRHPAATRHATLGSVGPVEDLDGFDDEPGFVDEPLPLDSFEPEPTA